MRTLRTPEVTKLTGLSRVTLWRLERKGEFPTRIQLSSNAVGWLEEDILQWLASRPRGIARSANYLGRNHA